MLISVGTGTKIEGYDDGAEILSRQELYTKPWKVGCPNVMLCTRGLPRTLSTAFHHSDHGGMQGNFSFSVEDCLLCAEEFIGDSPQGLTILPHEGLHQLFWCLFYLCRLLWTFAKGDKGRRTVQHYPSCKRHTFS